MACSFHQQSEAARALQAKAVTQIAEARRMRMQDRDEVQWRGAIRRMLTEQLNRVLGRLDSVTLPEFILDELNGLITQGDTEQTYIDLYVGQGEKYYEWAMDNVKGRSIYTRTKRLDPNDPYFGQMAEFVQAQVASRVVSITQTTREAARRAIQGAIEQSIADGLGIREQKRLVEQAVKEEWRIQRSFRPGRIARTEVGTVFNHASFSGAMNTGVDFRKTWMVTRDGRERETHLIAGNQEPIDKGARFLVGGAEMLYPGDPAGPAEEVINCRCATGYVTDF